MALVSFNFVSLPPIKVIENLRGSALASFSGKSGFGAVRWDGISVESCLLDPPFILREFLDCEVVYFVSGFVFGFGALFETLDFFGPDLSIFLFLLLLLVLLVSESSNFLFLVGFETDVFLFSAAIFISSLISSFFGFFVIRRLTDSIFWQF